MQNTFVIINKPPRCYTNRKPDLLQCNFAQHQRLNTNQRPSIKTQKKSKHSEIASKKRK